MRGSHHPARNINRLKVEHWFKKIAAIIQWVMIVLSVGAIFVLFHWLPWLPGQVQALVVVIPLFYWVFRIKYSISYSIWHYKGETELPDTGSEQLYGSDSSVSEDDTINEKGEHKKFQPFIRDLPLWGEALFLTVACLAAYFLFVLTDDAVPSGSTRVEVSRVLFRLITIFVLPGATIVYLVRRWLSGK